MESSGKEKEKRKEVHGSSIWNQYSDDLGDDVDDVIGLRDLSGSGRGRGRPKIRETRVEDRDGRGRGARVTDRGDKGKTVDSDGIRRSNRLKDSQQSSTSQQRGRDVPDGVDGFFFSDSDDEDWLEAEGRPDYYSDEDDIDSTTSEERDSQYDYSEDEPDHGLGGELHEEVEPEICNEDDGLSDVDSGGSDAVSDSEDEFMSRAELRKKKRENPDPFRGMYDNQYIPNENGEVKFAVGQVFFDVTTFRDALKDYAIKGGYMIKMIKNDTVRVTAKCVGDGCHWRIHASVMADGITFRVKTMQEEHLVLGIQM